MRRSFKVLVFHSLEKKKRKKNSQIEILFTKKDFTTLVQLGTLFGIDHRTLVNSLVNEVYNRVGFSFERERIYFNQPWNASPLVRKMETNFICLGELVANMHDIAQKQNPSSSLKGLLLTVKLSWTKATWKHPRLWFYPN